MKKRLPIILGVLVVAAIAYALWRKPRKLTDEEFAQQGLERLLEITSGLPR